MWVLWYVENCSSIVEYHEFGEYWYCFANYLLLINKNVKYTLLFYGDLIDVSGSGKIN